MNQQRYLGEHHANGSAPVWKFLVAVTMGQLAGWGAGAIVRGTMSRAPCSSRDAAGEFATLAGFWLVGGISWVLMTRSSARSPS